MRQRLGLIARILISGGILAYLASRIDFAKLGHVVMAMRGEWMGFAGLTFVPLAWLATERWRILLQVQGVNLSRWSAGQLFMIGHFFNAFLLGTTGGDVVKMFYVAQRAPDKKSAAALSVLMDRIVGLVALLMLAAVLCVVHYDFLTQTPQTTTAVWSVFMFSGAALGVLTLAALAPQLSRIPVLSKLMTRLPKPEVLTQLHEALVRYGTAPRALGQAVGLAFFIHALGFAQAYGAARALWGSAAFDFWQFMSVYPIMAFLAALPVSISGLGVREGLAVMFFALCGIAPEYATAVGLAVFALNLLWSLVGGLVYVSYDHAAKQASDFSPYRP
jgi:uncharacterized membrane protein YbhN (UPF0104 family)